MEQKYNSHIIKGCSIAILYILFDIFTTFSNAHNYQWLNFIAWAIIIFGVIISVQLLAKVTTQNKTFALLFSHGFKTAAVATCLIFIYTLVMVYLANTNSIQQKVDLLLTEVQKNRQPITEKMRANALKITRLMTIAGTVIGTLFLGLIGAAIGAVGATKPINHNNN